MVRRAAMAAAAAVLVVGAARLASPGQADGNVTVVPRPGTDTANPATTISFRGATARRLGDVAVVGTGSGVHHGTLRDHRDGSGATFIPDRPFEPGERVQVIADVTFGVDRDVTFQIGVPGEVNVRAALPETRDVTPPRRTEFVSTPDIAAPVVDVSGQRVAGVVLSTPQGTETTRNGAMITDGAGDLVWWRSPQDGRTLANLFVTRVDGEPVLAWYEGRAPHTPGWFMGEWIVVDSTYREVARFGAGNGLDADVHELELTDRGTALLVAYQPLVRDATAQGGNANTIVLDGVIQELDIMTGDVLFEWHSLDHVPLSWSVIPVPETNLYDYAHINSVQEGPSGNYLVTMRHTSQVAEIDRDTGELVWVIGGDHATLRTPNDPGISFPHHARWVDDQRLSLFDNGVQHDPQVSRGVVYGLDVDGGRADVVRTYVEDPPLYTETQGSLLQRGEDVLAGWGELGSLSVFARDSGPPTGRIHMHAASYRMSVADWDAVPAYPPTARVRGDRVFASWNGATGVVAWELRSGDDPTRLTTARRMPSTGFETALPIEGRDRFGVVRALDANGALLSTTEPFALTDGDSDAR